MRKSRLRIWKFEIFSLSLKLCFEDTFPRNNKEKLIFLWFFAHLFVSLPSVTTNQRCIGHQSSMKCVAPIGSYCSPRSQGWGDPKEWGNCLSYSMSKIEKMNSERYVSNSGDGSFCLKADRSTSRRVALIG